MTTITPEAMRRSAKTIKWTVHPPSKLIDQVAYIGGGSGSGEPATPIDYRLRLLPSGPDLVHGPTSRGTRAIDAVSRRANPTTGPSKGDSASLERIASDRTPLISRLARSIWKGSRSHARSPDRALRRGFHALREHGAGEPARRAPGTRFGRRAANGVAAV